MPHSSSAPTPRPTLLPTAILLTGAALAAQALAPQAPTDVAPPHPFSLAGDTGYVPNRGQWPAAVLYRAAFGPLAAWIHADGFTLQVDWPDTPPGPSGDPAGSEPAVAQHSGAVVRVTFVGARAAAVRAVGGPSSTRRNYLFGDDPSRWVTDVRAVAAAELLALRPGVDAVVHELDGHFEYDLRVAPGTALGDLALHVDGADRLEIDPDGSLRFDTAVGSFRQTPPRAFVERDGERTPVRCSVELVDDATFRFVAPDRPLDRALVVDPGIVWSNVLGTNANDHAQGCRPGRDAAGNVYLGGLTVGANFPVTPGAYQSTTGLPGTQKAWVARFTPGGALSWATYLGGTTGHERTRSVAVAPNGVVTACGASSSSNFPQVNSFDPVYNGAGPLFWGDAWLARLDPGQSGTSQLRWSTYVGGSADERLNTLHVDASGVVTAGGWTYSPSIAGAAFPGAFQPAPAGVRDAMLIRLDPSQPPTSQLVYFTFFGGSGDDYLSSTLVDANGVITFDGATTSVDLPTTPNAYATALTGADDHLVARIDPSLPAAAQLIWSTYVGGTGADFLAGDSVLDAAGVVTTAAWSQGPGFPTTPGAYDTTANGDYDAVIYRLDPSQSGAAQLVWSTFYGGTGAEGGNGIVLDQSGGVVFVGTNSLGGLPVTPTALQATFAGGGATPSDGYLARLDASGSQLVHATYLGGAAGVDYAYGLVFEDCGDVFVHGLTQSNDFPTTSGGAQGSDDVFLARLDLLPIGVARFGTPTSGCFGTPQSSASSAPAVGNAAFGFSCLGAPPATVGVLAWSNAALPAPLPLLGIDVWLDPTAGLLLLTVFTDPLGTCFFGLPLPNVPTLAGASGATQFAFFQACPTLLSSSCGLAVTIQ